MVEFVTKLSLNAITNMQHTPPPSRSISILSWVKKIITNDQILSIKIIINYRRWELIDFRPVESIADREIVHSKRLFSFEFVNQLSH